MNLFDMTKHISKFLVAILVTFVMFGCASQQNKDPLEGLNRTVYKFNDVVDKVALKPVAQGYLAITPTPVQTGVNNFFKNIRDVVTLVNELFQFKFKQAANTTGRIAVNTTVGVLGVSQKITNSEGASVSSSEGIFIYANSHGFMGGYPTSRHSIGCSVIAEEKSMMQRDYWYSSSRHVEDLESVESVGKLAGTRTVSRLGAKKIHTCHAPVIFEAPIASGLISSLISAISGGNLYRQSSFLLNSLGEKVASEQLTIEEDPFLFRGDASSMFDDEGVATNSRLLVDQGTINGYLLSSYSARKLGMQSTGNAGGAHNLIVKTGNQNLQDLIKLMHKGLFVTELLGHGINMVTGDYSRGAAGFWVEDGVIAYPVEEITIAGNMKDMLKQILAIGNDVYRNGSKHTGSILLEKMSIASS